jgi:hypothetical protein
MGFPRFLAESVERVVSEWSDGPPVHVGSLLEWFQVRLSRVAGFSTAFGRSPSEETFGRAYRAL